MTYTDSSQSADSVCLSDGWFLGAVLPVALTTNAGRLGVFFLQMYSTQKNQKYYTLPKRIHDKVHVG